jgi:hypothetical protein
MSRNTSRSDSVRAATGIDLQSRSLSFVAGLKVFGPSNALRLPKMPLSPGCETLERDREIICPAICGAGSANTGLCIAGVCVRESADANAGGLTLTTPPAWENFARSVCLGEVRPRRLAPTGPGMPGNGRESRSADFTSLSLALSVNTSEISLSPFPQGKACVPSDP